MSRKPVILLLAGISLLILSIALVVFSFVSDSPSPAPVLTSFGTCILAFILGLYLISKGAKGLKNVESSATLRSLGTVVFCCGLAVLSYAAVAFFLRNDFPPNTETSRLPSLYLLFAGIVITLFGAAVRNFRLHK